MAKKSILLAVADPQALTDVAQALGDGWDATSTSSETDAVAHLEKRSFDALLVDFNLGSPDGSELLNQASEKRPEIVRFSLVYEADLALVAAKVLESHQILPKPIELASLKSRIENGVAPEDADSNQSGNDPATDFSTSPIIPAVYSDVLKALDSPGVTCSQVGKIIARDAALTSEILSLTKSSYLGLPRNISGPVEAVESLGLEAVKAAVMALRFLAEHSRLKPGYLSLDLIWQHSINVGQIARDLILFETKDRALASQALVAGLLHDLGKVVLATNFDDLYGRVHSLARKQPVAIWEIEKEMFGANHGEIGACLVGMWNLPGPIVEATALHHEPPLGENDQLTPLAAVHIANVLERELWLGGEDTLVAPIINAPFLNELGLLQRLPVWRAAFANARSANLEPETESAETAQSTGLPGSRTANQLSGPVAATRTTNSGQPPGGDRTTAFHAGRHRRSWVYAGAAALALLVLCWSTMKPELNQPHLVYARTQAPYEAPAVVHTVPSPETAADPQVSAAVAVSPEPPSPAPSESVPKSAASLPAPEPDATTPPAATPPATTPPEAAASVTTVTEITPPSVAPQEKALPDFRVNGIIYSNVRPSAIVNGQTVNIGDRVSGATVIEIGRTSVTLEIKGQRKTCVLR